MGLKFATLVHETAERADSCIKAENNWRFQVAMHQNKPFIYVIVIVSLSTCNAVVVSE